MPKVTFLPFNKVCEAQVGESLLDIALNNDIPMQHACGGYCACTTCQVIIKAGAENLSEMEEDEEDRMDDKGVIQLHSRLGCQSKVKGDIIVEVVNTE
jgi:ferredoxin, 2Fe-2S